MAAGSQFQPTAWLLLLVQVPSCHAFGIPSIAIYALVAGGALFLVLTALFITLCIKKCPCRKEGSDGDSKKKSTSKKDVEKGKAKKTEAKRNGFFASSKKPKKAGDDKAAKKGEKVTKFKVKDEKKEKGGKKEKGDKAQKDKDKKKDEKKQKKGDKESKDKGKKDKGRKDNKNDKDTKTTGSKALHSWKNAVAKINTGKGSEVAPAKGSKVAWTIPADTKQKPKKAVGFGRTG